MFLVSTPQRCGSTWLLRLLCDMAGAGDRYVDGLAMGFRLARPREPGAVEKMASLLRQNGKGIVFKTHDVPSRDFDTLCGAMPELRVLTMHRDFRDTVVSRYFYLRYYWRTDPGLGPLPVPFAKFLAETGDASDHQALEAVLETEFVREWAREWAAFERPFTTPNAIRITYTGMLDESEFPRLVEFTGLPLRNRNAFPDEQKRETRETGRDGKARFNRNGRAGQWRDWFSDDQAKQLDALAAAAVERAATDG
jgi:hypothetical protein